MNQRSWVGLGLLTIVLSGLTADAACLQSQDEVVNSIGIKLVLIPKGSFTMGSPYEEEDGQDDEEQHTVVISKDFYLGKTEVTQGQYEKVMGNNPSHFQKRRIRKTDSSRYPVESVSWDDAVEFCKQLSTLSEEQAAGRVYRLPTEAEWEYACRAGSKTAYSFGEDRRLLAEHAWFNESSQGHTQPVGQRRPNPWGLFDMHGNVWEWCSDWYGEYPEGTVTDPTGPATSNERVFRGGCWHYDSTNCRSAFRNAYVPSSRYSSIGFRVVMTSIKTP